MLKKYAFELSSFYDGGYPVYRRLTPEQAEFLNKLFSDMNKATPGGGDYSAYACMDEVPIKIEDIKQDKDTGEWYLVCEEAEELKPGMKVKTYDFQYKDLNFKVKKVEEYDGYVDYRCKNVRKIILTPNKLTEQAIRNATIEVLD